MVDDPANQPRDWYWNNLPADTELRRTPMVTLREHLEAIRREALHDDPSEHVAAALAILDGCDVPVRWHNHRGTQYADYRMRLVPDPEQA